MVWLCLIDTPNKGLCSIRMDYNRLSLQFKGVKD